MIHEAQPVIEALIAFLHKVSLLWSTRLRAWRGPRRRAILGRVTAASPGRPKRAGRTSRFVSLQHALFDRALGGRHLKSRLTHFGARAEPAARDLERVYGHPDPVYCFDDPERSRGTARRTGSYWTGRPDAARIRRASDPTARSRKCLSAAIRSEIHSTS